MCRALFISHNLTAFHRQRAAKQRTMLTEYQKGSIFGAIIVCFAFAASFSTLQYRPYSAGNVAASNTKVQEDKQETFWEVVSNDPTAFFTGALVVVGGVQAVLFLWQLDLIRRSLADTQEAAGAAKLSAEIANKTLRLSKETAERQLRAYVSIKELGKNAVSDNNTKTIIGWSFHIVWQNTGATPTRDMLTHTSIRFEESGIPEGYRFPDMWIIRKEQVYPPVTLSPNSTFAEDIGMFSIDQLREVINGKKTLYFYGWADYNDVFSDSERHRTEFCAQVLFPGDPSYVSDGNIGFYIYRKHNGVMTNVCGSQKRTPQEKKSTIFLKEVPKVASNGGRRMPIRHARER